VQQIEQLLLLLQQRQRQDERAKHLCIRLKVTDQLSKAL
jgi:hypothetical protein